MNKNKVIEIIKILRSKYPDAKCSLDFSSPFELGIAVMLSAQCTDERVNKITATIFPKYNQPEHFANMDITKLEQLIHSCGFYRNKAKNIKLYSQKIIEDYNGELPNDINELVKLAGLGRKSANVIMLDAFNDPQRNSRRHTLQKSI